MINDLKYSVIVPVYNAARTLRRCLDSLADQKFSSYEILLINDGSDDKSDDICRAYAGKYPQIRYYLKENGGVSSARNMGLACARGKYILFADSDDYVSEDYFEVIDASLSQTSVDMLLFGAQEASGKGKRWITGVFAEYDEENVARHVADAMRRYLFSSLWNKLFRRDIIERFCLRFENGLAIGEDQTFIFAYAMHIRSIASVDNIIYNVDVSDRNSLSRKVRPYLTEQLIEVNRCMYLEYRSVTHSPVAARCYAGALSWMTYRSAYSCCKELLKIDFSSKQRRSEIRKICRLYRAENVRPVGMKCRLIALPVKCGLAHVIDLLVKRKERTSYAY